MAERHFRVADWTNARRERARDESRRGETRISRPASTLFSQREKITWRIFCSSEGVRLLSLLLAVAFAVTSAAGSLPLTNKEITLMLRSGYSSDSVLIEVQSRRVLDALDPAAKKSMIEFGANAQLVAALES